MQSRFLQRVAGAPARRGGGDEHPIRQRLPPRRLLPRVAEESSIPVVSTGRLRGKAEKERTLLPFPRGLLQRAWGLCRAEGIGVDPTLLQGDPSLQVPPQPGVEADAWGRAFFQVGWRLVWSVPFQRVSRPKHCLTQSLSASRC